jgi:hypothetical protein
MKQLVLAMTMAMALSTSAFAQNRVKNNGKKVVIK